MSVEVNPHSELPLKQLLSAIPLRNKSIRFERIAPKTVIVYVPLKKKWFMSPPFSWLLRFSHERRIQLDPVGSEVWDACNGETSCETIIERFAKAHILTFHEARLCIMEFLRQLTRRGMIVLVGMGTKE